ncbi:MAG: protein-L-isoaspartate(D-aspartate) O-methyltransferase [Rhodospirillales bacterium]|nr:protein-L-isoaspartate(D-aspartate) O-methyltransferase [Rhodospirillales bacterium]
MTENFAQQRSELIETIADEARRTAGWTGRKRFSTAVMKALAQVPRHEFTGDQNHSAAYINQPLPIGHGQTISQPYIVALMTELLDIEAGDRALEIGTGCGYQTAILAGLAAKVYTVEIIPELAMRAAEIFRKLGLGNIHQRISNGREGWPEFAPFDVIMVTAAAPSIPQSLIDQLAPGGRMVIPVGEYRQSQNLIRLTKSQSGEIDEKVILAVAFVPLVD